MAAKLVEELPGVFGERRGFGEVGDSGVCFDRVVKGLKRLKEIEENVEADSMNTEKYVKELAKVMHEITGAYGRLFEQENLRMMPLMFAGVSGSNYKGGFKDRGVMEYKVITNLKAVNGDKSWFRQWHLKFVTALGQVRSEYEEIVQRMVKEIDLGKDLSATLESLSIDYPELYQNVSGDVWKILIDKAEAEAYDKIKSLPQGEGMRAYGVLYRWFTDVSGLGLAEQAKRLMQPEPPKKEEDLAESIDG